jgi:hypothetical protein
MELIRMRLRATAGFTSDQGWPMTPFGKSKQHYQQQCDARPVHDCAGGVKA